MQNDNSPFNGRPGIRRINEEPAKTESYTPAGQQTLESHVIVPTYIAFIVAVVCTGIAAGVSLKWFTLDPFFLLLVFGFSFLATFMKRLGVGDQLLWVIENFLEKDIDGDGEVGYAPRDIPKNQGEKSSYVNMPPVESRLTRGQWEEVAIACLNQLEKVSRRGLTQNTALSQSQAALAAKILNDKGRAVDGKLNGAGWDWLIVHLPEHTQCRLERPIDNPPTPKTGEGVVVEGYVNQPTNQPTTKREATA